MAVYVDSPALKVGLDDTDLGPVTEHDPRHRHSSVARLRLLTIAFKLPGFAAAESLLPPGRCAPRRLGDVSAGEDLGQGVIATRQARQREAPVRQ